MARHIGREHANLAVGDLAGRAGVLPTNAAGRLALLEKAGLIDHQNSIVGSKLLNDIVAHDGDRRETGVRARKGYFQVCFPAEGETTWPGS